MVQPFVWKQAVPSPETRAAAADWAQPLLKLFPLPTGSTISAGVGETVMRGTRPAGLQTGGIRLDQAITRRISLFGRYNDSPSHNEFGALAVNSLELRSQALTIGLNALARPRTPPSTSRFNESQATADSSWSVGEPCALHPLTGSFFSEPIPLRPSHAILDRRRRAVRQRDRRAAASAAVPGDRQRVDAPGLPQHSGRRGLPLPGGRPPRSHRLAERDRRRPDGPRRPAETLDLAVSRSERIGEGRRDVVWIQDNWQVGKRLTLAAGLRWEYSPPPPSSDQTVFLNNDGTNVVAELRPLWRNSLRNFAPRFGAAWQLTSDGRTVLRAGGGLYYLSSMSIATEILNGGPLSVTTLSSSVRAPASSTAAASASCRTCGCPTSDSGISRSSEPSDRRPRFRPAYVGSSAHRLLRREAGGPGSSVTSMVALTTNHGASNYHGAQAQYRRRMSRGVQVLAGYMLSRSIDNGSSDSFLMWAAPGLPPDRARSDFDLRHSATVSGTWEPAKLRGWAFDAVFHARSGFPITVLQAEEYQGIALTNAFRPNQRYGQPLWGDSPGDPGGRVLNPIGYVPTAPGVQGMLGRNAIAGFGMSQLDLSARREFRLDEHRSILLRVEAYNALNHANFADPVRYLNSPVFGQSTSMLNLMLGTGSPGSGLSPLLQTGGPRSLQGLMRFQF